MTVRDNGRGIPVDPHLKFKDISALEVVLTTLHSGGKFGGDAYKTSGGLHGVGLSVVNALSAELNVEIARDKKLWKQTYKQGKPKGKLQNAGKAVNRRGTSISFRPDPEIFGDKAVFRPATLYNMAKAKTYLFKGSKSAGPAMHSLSAARTISEKDTLHFPNGLSDYLTTALDGRETVTGLPFSGEADLNGGSGRAEWALAWAEQGDGSIASYCRSHLEGGTHENGLKSSLARGLKSFGEMSGNKRANIITGDDVFGGSTGILGIHSRPRIPRQTKEKLSSPGVAKLVENSVKDHFEHFLTGNPKDANALLDHVLERAEERLRRRKDREFARKTRTRKSPPSRQVGGLLRRFRGRHRDLPRGGDSAGGSAKQARDRKTQAILPLRGKILNVASATEDKMRANQEIMDLIQALGCGYGDTYDPSKLRYERVVIMTDADVDGAHIASLLMTFSFAKCPRWLRTVTCFSQCRRFTEYPRAVPSPTPATTRIGTNCWKRLLPARGKIDISRFKDLGEMPPAQLKETTMNPVSRTLLKVVLPEGENVHPVKKGRSAKNKTGSTADLVERLMGRKPEQRLKFIQQNAEKVDYVDV